MTDSELSIIQSVARQSAIIRAEVRKALLRHWLSESEAAIYLGCSPDTIGKLRTSGRLKAGLLGKRWRYHVAELDKAVVQGRTI